jgi:hypothetical protein
VQAALAANTALNQTFAGTVADLVGSANRRAENNQAAAFDQISALATSQQTGGASISNQYTLYLVGAVLAGGALLIWLFRR